MKNLTTYLKRYQRTTFLLILMITPFIISSCSDDDDSNMSNKKTIVELAIQHPDLNTLVDALSAANLVGYLSGEGPFTVFAPTDAAFQKLDPNTLNTIISTPSLLTSLLQYHVVGAKVNSGDLTNGPVNTLLSGQSIDVNISGGMVTLNGSSAVTTADINGSNGVIHIIDEVLIPDDFFAQTIVQIAAGSPDHSILVDALSKPELADLFAAANDPTQDLTVFAPTDAAFEAVLDALGKSSIDDIPVELLKEIVTYHILGTAVKSTELSNGDVETLLTGETVTVDVSSGVKINNANVTAADVMAVNGVVHIVDAVLLPSYVSYSVGTVAEPVLFEKDFTILAAALRKAELLETVATAPNLTVFAPDNSGFVAAGITSLEGLDKETLTPILLYHVLGAKVLSTELPESGMAETLNGENIYLGYLNNKRVLINGLTEIKAVDLEKSNGVIHTIDRTLTPPAGDVVDIALALADNGDDSEFTVLTSLLASDDFSDILEAIKNAENITIFAPTDAAFDDISDVVDGLTTDQISSVLKYHAVGARSFSYNLVAGQEIPTLNTQTLKVESIIGDLIILKDKTDGLSDIVEVNIHGSNGVIHVVDRVLIPEL